MGDHKAMLRAVTQGDIATLIAWNHTTRAFRDDAVLQHLTLSRVTRGTVLWRKGDVPDRYLILHAGRLNLNVQPGTGFGEAPFLRRALRGGPCVHHNTAVALADSLLLELPADIYERFVLADHVSRFENAVKVKTLSDHYLFENWRACRVDDFAACLRVRTFQPSTRIVKRATKLTHVYLVARGDVLLRTRVQAGVLDVAQLQCGAIIGDLEVLDNCPTHLVTAIALTTVTVYEISKVDFERYVIGRTLNLLRASVDERRRSHALRALRVLEREASSSSNFDDVCDDFEAKLAVDIEASFARLWDHAPPEALSKLRTALATPSTAAGAARTSALRVFGGVHRTRRQNRDNDYKTALRRLTLHLQRDTRRNHKYAVTRRARNRRFEPFKDTFPTTPAEARGGRQDDARKALLALATRDDNDDQNDLLRLATDALHPYVVPRRLNVLVRPRTSPSIPASTPNLRLATRS